VNQRARLVPAAVVLVALLGAAFGRAATHRDAIGATGVNGATGELPALPRDLPPLTGA
jgi:hypothetical protein